MRRFGLFLVAMLCVAFLASNAFAEDSMDSSTDSINSLYQEGNNSIYVGYNSLTDVSLPVTGFKVGYEYFFTDNIGAGVEGNFLTESAFGLTANYTNIAALFGYHAAFADSFGGYAKAGYGSTTVTLAGFTGSASISGFTYELGVESKFSSNIFGHIGYKGISMTIGGATATISGLTGGLDFVF